ncbi:MAG TPA: radical SAM protein [Gemmatimonadaceae bacterium]|nr:radical SAM protein [Gemmatimonadaceae bacterium]
MRMSMDRFEQRLGARARRERHPLSCLFEITPRCNLRCHFCYVALDPYRGPYLSTDQACRVLDVVERAGVLWLTLTGGEIFSRRDFAAIYEYALSKGLLVTLYTNATMVTEAQAALLARRPPFSVEVSIYGADAAHYEATTGVSGSFARFERGIERLRAAGVSLLMKCPVSTLSAGHVRALVTWCQDRGLPFKADPVIDARHDGGQEPTLYRIEPRQVVALRDEIHELRHGAPRAAGPVPECSARDDAGGGEELYTCGAGRIGFFVDALGNASHCVIDREPSFPILDMPWEDLWAEMGRWVTQPLPADAPCSGCSLRSGCSNCPARARLATGNPYAKDQYQCDITHAIHGLPPDRRVQSARKRPLAACTA